VNGERVLESTNTTNKREAEQIYQAKRRRANSQRHHVLLDANRITFGEVAGQFLAKTGNSEYHQGRLQHLLPVFGGCRLVHITRGMVDEYRTMRLKRVTNATVNRDVSTLKHILFWAVDEGFLGINPLARYRELPEPRRPRRVLSVQEEDALLEVASRHLRQAIILAVDTGMRRGEILSQRREHLDAARRLLVVSKSKTPGGVGREIPWTTRVAEILEPLTGGEGFVVLYQGEQIKLLKTSWQGAVRRSGIRYLRFHDLRHTFNTRLMEANVSQDVRKTLMGHSDGDINAVYTHVELPTKRGAIAKLERWQADQCEALKQQTQTADKKEDSHGSISAAHPEGESRSVPRTPKGAD